jgi:hypothetical protein
VKRAVGGAIDYSEESSSSGSGGWLLALALVGGQARGLRQAGRQVGQRTAQSLQSRAKRLRLMMCPTQRRRGPMFQFTHSRDGGDDFRLDRNRRRPGGSARAADGYGR